MGNYIHNVPSNSYTSGATVRNSGPVAALPAGDSDRQGLEQELDCPCCPPAPSCSAFCPMSCMMGQQHHSLPKFAYLHDGAKNGSRLLLTQAMGALASRHRSGQSILKTAENSCYLLESGIPHAQV